VARPRRSDAYRSNVGTAPEAFIPTGNTELDDYLHQLELEPGNWQLRLAIARIGIQTNRLDLAIHHYKRLIKDDRSGDQVIIDLQESIDETNDQYLLQRLYRLLGDAYAQQDRYREAVAAYGCIFQR
jgi:tetratricopeptide (TPR) repeat protein